MKTVSRLVFLALFVSLALGLSAPKVTAQGAQADPSVKAWSAALNPAQDEYLVIWHDGSTFFGHFVRGSTVSLGNTFEIGGDPGIARTIEMAFNLRRGEWFFIWNDGENIMGRHLFVSGRPKGSPFVVVPGVSAEPELSIDRGGQWLVGWADPDGNWWNQVLNNVGTTRRGPARLVGTGGLYGQPADYGPNFVRNEHQLVWSVGDTVFAQLFFSTGRGKNKPFVLLEDGMAPDLTAPGLPMIFHRDDSIYSVRLFENLTLRGALMLGVEAGDRSLTSETFVNPNRRGRLTSLITDGDTFFAMLWLDTGVPLRGTFHRVFDVP